MEPFNLANRVAITTASPSVDLHFGPYASVAEANSIIIPDLRAKGKVVGIVVGDEVIDYCWKVGISDEDLVVKTTAATIVQDNKFKPIYIGLPQILTFPDTVATYINALPSFEITEVQNALFIVIQANELTAYPETKHYVLNELGKGFYGVGGVQLEMSDLIMTYYDKASVIDISTLPTTQTINLGIVTGTLSDALVGLNPAITVQDQIEGYRLVKSNIDGIDKEFLYTADGGLSSDLVITDEDFKPFGEENRRNKENKKIYTESYLLENEDTDKILLFLNVNGCTITVPSGLRSGNRYEGKQLEGNLIFVEDGVLIHKAVNENTGTGEKYAVWGLDSISQDEYVLYGKLELSGNNDVVHYGGDDFGEKKVIGSNDNQDFAIKTNGIDRLTVLKNGQIGIGTDAPTDSALHIVKEGRGYLRMDIYRESNYGGGIEVRRHRGTKIAPMPLKEKDMVSYNETYAYTSNNIQQNISGIGVAIYEVKPNGYLNGFLSLGVRPEGFSYTPAIVSIFANKNVRIGDEHPAGASGASSTKAPVSKLVVLGGVQISKDEDLPTLEKAGTMRYRKDNVINKSYFEMCMQTGATTFEWVVINEKTW